MSEDYGAPDLASSPARRNLLRSFAGVAGGFVAIQTAGMLGCSPIPIEPGGLRIPLSQVPIGERVRVSYMGQQVEIHRTADSATARSLVCTHFGCLVRWQEKENAYHCPCHNGLYDASGKVIGGPPTKPLTQFKVVISGDTLIVGAPLQA